MPRHGMLPSPLRVVALVAVVALVVAAGAAPVAAQVRDVSLVHAGRAVPLEMTPGVEAMGRALARGLLATARRDVTRPISNEEVEALGRRGTLLRVRLSRPEQVLLLGLGARTRSSRLAAYVPPDRDGHAFVFLGRAKWDRIVVVRLPRELRSELRRLRQQASD